MNKIHFIGIGGIGMSALAQFFADHGATVSGSDREKSPVTEMLEGKGIMVSVPQKAENVPEDVEQVVYSDAVPEDNPERTRARELGIPECSYFEMLGKVSADKKTIAIAGTHGKTTTTGMLGSILVSAGASPTVVVGSILKDWKSNYVHGDSDLFVVEACEWKDHILKLSPKVLVITNLEWDHTDYFPSLAALQETFRKAVAKVPAEGAVVTDTNNPNIMPILGAAKAKVIDYTKEPAYESQLPGEFNEMNARASAAAARVAVPEIKNTIIYDSIASFTGTWRRFEYKGKTTNGAEVYDDYAHHPTAIQKTLKALRAKTPGKIFVAFHPHLYSRTRDLMDGFAHAFGDADDVVIMKIYPAREEFDGVTTNAALAKRIAETGTNAQAMDSFDDIAAYLEEHAGRGDVIMTMGAGDIYKVADSLVSK